MPGFLRAPFFRDYDSDDFRDLNCYKNSRERGQIESTCFGESIDFPTSAAFRRRGRIAAFVFFACVWNHGLDSLSTNRWDGILSL